MQNFQNNFETRKGSFISAFSICMTVPLNSLRRRENVWNKNIIETNSTKFRCKQVQLFIMFRNAQNNS